MSESSKALIDGWLQISDWISVLIITGISLCALAIISRRMGLNSLNIKDISFPLNKFWLIAIAFTLAHGFLAWSFVNTTEKVKLLSQEERKIAWIQLTEGNNLLFNGMQPRIRTGEISLLGLKVTTYGMKWEPSTALSLAFAVTLFFAAANRARKNYLGYVDYMMTGLCFCIINWMLGSAWASSASQIASGVRLAP